MQSILREKRPEKLPDITKTSKNKHTSPKKFIEDIEWILNKIDLGVFKRVQSAPIVSISKSCFGNDFRENQTKFEKSHKYLSLKEAILNENK